jgi:hypothetical protein
MAGTTLGAIPVFMRVGDGEEYEIGAIVPEIGEMELDDSGAPFVTVSTAVTSLLPAFLRSAADEMERASGQ